MHATTGNEGRGQAGAADRVADHIDGFVTFEVATLGDDGAIEFVAQLVLARFV